jgi:hypothetical protein
MKLKKVLLFAIAITSLACSKFDVKLRETGSRCHSTGVQYEVTNKSKDSRVKVKLRRIDAKDGKQYYPIFITLSPKESQFLCSRTWSGSTHVVYEIESEEIIRKIKKH